MNAAKLRRALRAWRAYDLGESLKRPPHVVRVNQRKHVTADQFVHFVAHELCHRRRNKLGDAHHVHQDKTGGRIVHQHLVSGFAARSLLQRAHLLTQLQLCDGLPAEACESGPLSRVDLKRGVSGDADVSECVAIRRDEREARKKSQPRFSADKRMVAPVNVRRRIGNHRQPVTCSDGLGAKPDFAPQISARGRLTAQRTSLLITDQQ